MRLRSVSLSLRTSNQNTARHTHMSLTLLEVCMSLVPEQTSVGWIVAHVRQANVSNKCLAQVSEREGKGEGGWRHWRFIH